ncbi:MAG: ABC transporter ATP-binding protein [Pseudomonadota bacterium]
MLLTVRDVEKSFPGEPPLRVLSRVSLSLDAGETLALTGESGSGKSTLLHIIGGLETADQGSVSIGGEELVGRSDSALAALRRSHIGVVFQQFNLIPSLTIRDNLSFHARLGGRVDDRWLAQLAEGLGLSGLLKRYPEQLSGGQQQRVAIGRALAGRPKLLLADEPTGNLDENTGDAVMGLMLRLTQEAGSALLMVTHSPTRAAALGRQLRLSHGALS